MHFEVSSFEVKRHRWGSKHCRGVLVAEVELITRTFRNWLPSVHVVKVVHHSLAQDIECIIHNDPTSTSREQVQVGLETFSIEIYSILSHIIMVIWSGQNWCGKHIGTASNFSIVTQM